MILSQAENKPSGSAPTLREDISTTDHHVAQDGTELEVDIMVLDYTAYEALKICLSSRRRGLPDDGLEVERPLAVFDSFLTLFKAKHPDYSVDAELGFRILHLKVTALLTQRTAKNRSWPSESLLEDLRSRNQVRAKKWIGSLDRIPTNAFDVTLFDTQLPFPRESLESHRLSALNQIRGMGYRESESCSCYGSLSSVSLLEILPMFMELTEARNLMNNGVLTESWMNLAGEFMLQACLEQYLVLGEDGTDAIDEAFAWGCDSAIHTTESPENQNRLHNDNMFEEEDGGSEVETWTKIRGFYLDELSLNQDQGLSDLEIHLSNLAIRYPIDKFEMKLLDFLNALGDSIDIPVLSQLERGKMKDMDEEQTQDFMEMCGLVGGGKRFFDPPVGFKSF